MLSRADTVIRLIEIRKMIKVSEDNLEEMPDDHYKKLKQELDRLLIDVIGVPEEGQHKINEILDKAIAGQIKPQTATVAVHEIFLDYQNDSDYVEKKNSNDKDNKSSNDSDSEKGDNVKKKVSGGKLKNSDLQELYNSGYR